MVGQKINLEQSAVDYFVSNELRPDYVTKIRFNNVLEDELTTPYEGVTICFDDVGLVKKFENFQKPDNEVNSITIEEIYLSHKKKHPLLKVFQASSIDQYYYVKLQVLIDEYVIHEFYYQFDKAAVIINSCSHEIVL